MNIHDELKISIDEASRMTKVVNDCLLYFINNLDPREFKGREKEFQRLIISSIAMISATMIDKISGTFHIKREKIIEDFQKQLNLSFKWVDYKNNKKE